MFIVAGSLVYHYGLPVAVGIAEESQSGDSSHFETTIRLLFTSHCVECHGPQSQQGGLRLDARHFALQGGDGGPVIVASHPQESELLRRVRASDLSERMPPEEKPPLSAAEIDLLSRWIASGADWPESEYDIQQRHDPRRDHWAFQPVRVIAPPQRNSAGPSTPRNLIDDYIAAELAEQQLSRAPEADRHTLIRRLSLDLLGLPPSAEQIEDFVSDQSPLAWHALVDRMLASPRYGERWAQHWLDVIRYADTHGFEVNTPRENAWRYRDYVIRAFNDDLPYNQFVFEQIAGDTCGVGEATGFLVAAAALLPGQIGADDASKRLARQDALDEVITGTSAALLGITLGCARCHDHKFDPFTQRDYYAMQDFFAGLEYGDREVLDSDSAQRKRQAAELDKQISSLQQQVDAFDLIVSNVSGIGTGSPPERRRTPLNARRNVEKVSTQRARFVRFTVLETIDNNRHEPCIDELEIYAADDDTTNVALASLGAIASSSGNYPDEVQHRLDHINDGRYGNARSWISNQLGQGWVQIELPHEVEIGRIVWGRDREGVFQDRLAVRYTLAVSLDGTTWQEVASDMDRVVLPSGNVATSGTSGNSGPIGPVAELMSKITHLQIERDRLSKPVMAFAGLFREPEVTYVLRRGDAEQQVAPIANRVPELFSAATSRGSVVSESDRRIALARWIASDHNSLTSRVIANRVWQYHFGRGLVSTPSDFGNHGSRPTHPELLDWLANELVTHNWSLKHLHRLILTSETYRQSSINLSVANDIDRDNTLLWRFPSRRLESEAIRDSILFVTGELNLEMGGPGFDFFKSRGGLDGFPEVDEFRPQQLRRMIYAHKVRMEQVPVFGAFDCPHAGQAMPLRGRSTTAIQALNLFNSRFMIDRSNLLADRIARQGSGDPREQVQDCFQQVLGRDASDKELVTATQVVRDHGLATLTRVLLNCNEFLFLP